MGQDQASVALVESLGRAFASDEAEERRQATSELTRAQIDDALPLLVRALGDDDWRVRKEATLAARSFGGSRPLVTALVRVLGEVEDVGLRNAAVDVLSAAGPTAIGAVAEAYPKLDPDGRKLAVDTLGRSGSAGALGTLELALRDADANVRAAAVEAIAGLASAPRERVSAVLLRCLEAREGRDPVVLVAALEGLTALGVSPPWSLVAPLLDQPTLRAAALGSASFSQSPEAARAVAKVLLQTVGQAGAPFDRAVRALGALAEGDLAPAIREALAGAGPDLGARLVAAALPSSFSSSRGPVSGWLAPASARSGTASGSTDEQAMARRLMALRLAALIGAPGIVDAAVTALGEDALASEAHRGLVTVGAAGLAAMLGRLADDAVPSEARGVLVDVIVDVIEATAPSSPSAASLSALRAATGDLEGQVAARALRALARIGAEEDLARIAESTLAETRVVGAAAESALQSLAARHPVAARALVARLSSDPERALPVALLIRGSAADSPFDERDTTFLAHASTAGDGRTRRAAVEAVGALRAAAGAAYAGALEVLGFALTDEEPDVQTAAARALGRLCSAPDAPRASDVLDLVDRSGASALVAAAVRAIGEGMTVSNASVSSRGARPLAGVGASVPPADLVAALALFARGAPSQVALAAVDALAEAHRSGAPAAVSALAMAVDHPDEAVVKAALLKIASSGEASLGDPQSSAGGSFDIAAATAALARGLGHSSVAVRALAVEALSERGGERGSERSGEHGNAARAQLAKRLPLETDSTIADAIRRALARSAAPSREGGA